MKEGTGKLTKTQEFLLSWLSREDWSAYGECCGADLDELLRQGLAETATHGGAISGHTGVRLTPDGRALLRALEPQHD
jgi:hypothetical protein